MTDHYTIKLRGPADLERVNKMAQWAAGQVGKGWTIIITRKRTTQQNQRLHAIIDKIRFHWYRTNQPVYSREQCKGVFMRTMGVEAEMCDDFVNGGEPIPIGYKTSELDVSTFNDLMTVIEAYAAIHGIDLSEK
jgi:hypothetical protein